MSSRARLEVDDARPALEVPLGRDELASVVATLVANALEAADEPDGRVEVRAEEGAAEVRIVVRDNGRGVPAESLGRLFTPFFTTKKGAMGLSLSLAQATIRSHGGEIRAASEEGKGSEFVIVLPRAGGTAK